LAVLGPVLLVPDWLLLNEESSGAEELENGPDPKAASRRNLIASQRPHILDVAGVVETNGGWIRVIDAARCGMGASSERSGLLLEHPCHIPDTRTDHLDSLQSEGLGRVVDKVQRQNADT